MKRVTLNVTPRPNTGKGYNRRLRQQGRIPVVLYGLGMDPVNLSLDSHEFQLLVSRTGDDMVIYEVTGAEAGLKGQISVIRDAQRDPVTDRIIHLDLLRVDEAKPIDVEVPVHLEGEPIGVREGGLLEHGLRSIHLRCLIKNVPDAVTVPISTLTIGQAIHVADLAFGEGVELLSRPDDLVVSVALPRKEEVATAEGEGEEEKESAEGESSKD